ncbi:hypothetical protein [Rhizobium bangladeshense]|uniref:hypothetical protein n=1 Tax=Rhizobium bangladeshense TaxID=1138189 RepID=UPI002180D23C|nr:hypothetical protein [Rhizobium bangladeshense]
MRRETLVLIVLSAIVYISLWRATGMWYGLPANFVDGINKDPLPMRLLLMSLLIRAFTEAGMMLAPFILWSYTIIALTSLGPEFVSRFRKPIKGWRPTCTKPKI